MMNSINSLEELLSQCFACETPFDESGNLTDAGNAAYTKLIDAVYGLETIGAVQEGLSSRIVRELDEISNGLPHERQGGDC